MNQSNLKSENKIPRYIINLRKIKKWMENNNTTNPPRTYGKDLSQEEQRLGKSYNYIRRKVNETYINLKSDEEIERFEKQNPEMKEAKEFIQLVEKNKKHTYLENAKKIKIWMIENKKNKPPRYNGKNLSEEEKKLGLDLEIIKEKLIRKYEKLKDEKDKKKFKQRHPELDEVVEILNWIKERNIPTYLKNAREIQSWMIKNNTNKPPRAGGKNVSEEERRLGNALDKIRQNLIKKYQELQNEKDKEMFKQKHPELEEVIKIINQIDKNNVPIYLQHVREVKKWMLENNTTRPPRKQGINLSDGEKKLGIKLARVRNGFIKVYKNLKTEDEKKEFRKKHPETDEILKTVELIDKNNISPYLKNAKEIEQWMEKHNTNEPPKSKAKKSTSKESRLAKKLATIRNQLIKPYRNLETEEERIAYKKKHPEIDEVIEIINYIDERNPKAKRKENKNEDFNEAISTIENYILRPYMELQTEEERIKYLKKHPDLKYIVDLYEEITNARNEKRLQEAKNKRNDAKDKGEKARKLQEEVKSKLDKEISRE